MKLFDLVGVIRKHTLPLLCSYKAEDNCTIFEFDITGKNINWKAGQHGIFTIPEKKVRGIRWRAFSISTIPSENKLQIATKISAEPSSFKAAMQSLKLGEEIHLHGPYGWLYLKDHNSPVVMIAGGVGITPFRAIFKELERNNNRYITLIYSAKYTYLYKQELDEIASKDEKIKIIYTNTKEDIEKAVNETVNSATKDAYYFLSGAPSMVKNITKKLQNSQIPKRKIITDSFRGY